jgi:hypothetical protein
MADLNRYAGNVLPFASNATGTNRAVYGGSTQSDDIDDNITADFLTGWEIVSSSAAPTKQDFNALGYTSTLLISYLYQKGIPEWDTNQEYYTGSKAVGSDGMVYTSLTDSNTGNDPVSDLTNWLSEFSLYSMREVTHDITTDDDYTLTAVQNFYKRIKITDTNPFLTTDRNVIVNNIEREFVFENATLQTLTVKTSGGTGEVVAAGDTAVLRCDGTDVVSSDYIASDFIHNAATKTTPAPSDEFVIADSASSFSLKKLTWSNLRSAIASYIGALSDYDMVGTNGYLRLPSFFGGWMIQWGTYAVADATVHTFNYPETFPSECKVVFAVDSNSAIADTSDAYKFLTNNYTTSSFKVLGQNTPPGSNLFVMIAIGK